MKSLREYIVESQQWMSTPAEGDDFAIELEDGTLIETYIIEVADNCILLDSTEEINRALTEWAALEDTDEGDSGVIMEELGAGGQFSSLGEGAMKREMHDAAERMSLEDFKELYGYEDWIEEFWRETNGESDQVDEDQDAAQVAQKEFDMDAALKLGMSEAEYRGRKVALGKPMAGDVKKFKVYVKDPKTGNVKKVNFGHGGTSAKRAGQKTMRIRKSNPKARKSFRARHNCANPGPRTKARYWSCRKW